MTAIPKVEAANSAAEYADAVDSMLVRLNDAETRVMRGNAREPKPTDIERRLVRSGFRLVVAGDSREGLSPTPLEGLPASVLRVWQDKNKAPHYKTERSYRDIPCTDG